ncbi:MAG: hypothetical protein ACRDPD_24795 [Streptosporangiaceae bacterium]
MMAAGGLFLLGGGLTAAGILWPGLYDIGIVVLIVAAVGVVVRVGDWARVLLARQQQAGRLEGPVSPHGHGGGELR